MSDKPSYWNAYFERGIHLTLPRGNKLTFNKRTDKNSFSIVSVIIIVIVLFRRNKTYRCRVIPSFRVLFVQPYAEHAGMLIMWYITLIQIQNSKFKIKIVCSQAYKSNVLSSSTWMPSSLLMLQAKWRHVDSSHIITSRYLQTSSMKYKMFMV